MKLTEKQIEAAYNAFWKMRVNTDAWDKQGKVERDLFRMGIESAAPHVQYATTSPGEPLTEKEWNQIAYCIYEWESENRKPFGDIRDAIDAVLAKRNVAQPVAAAQPVDVDVMEIICNVYCDNRLGLIPWTQTPPRTKSDIKNGITAVAHALLDRMRGPVTPKELELWAITPGLCPSILAVIEYRIKRILRPKKQTPVEMVTELIDAYRGGVAKDIAEKIIEELEAHGDDGREPGDTRDEESLEDHNIQGLGAYRDVFDADGEQ